MNLFIAAFAIIAFASEAPPIAYPLPPSQTEEQYIPCNPALRGDCGREVARRTFRGGSQKPRVCLPYSVPSRKGDRFCKPVRSPVYCR